MPKCINCSLYSYRTLNNRCAVLNIPIKPDSAACPVFKTTLHNCAWCGLPIVGREYIITNSDPLLFVCEKCKDKTGICVTCKYNNGCDFRTNPIQISDYITQTLPNGQVAKIPNPQRVEVTCKENCKCYLEDLGCCRQNATTCGNWEPAWKTIERKDEEK